MVTLRPSLAYLMYAFLLKSRLIEIFFLIDRISVFFFFTVSRVKRRTARQAKEALPRRINFIKASFASNSIKVYLKNVSEKRYAKSRSNKQLWSKAYKYHTAECEPEKRGYKHIVVPCGLIAWSLFNDTYGFSVNDKRLEVNKTDIAWKSDKENKFGSDVYPENFQSGELIGGATLDESKPLSDQEDLLVWMRTAALPTFRKLYGRIEKDLEANATITVASRRLILAIMEQEPSRTL
ncbi:Ala-interacting subunit [Thalictrum thalictroides]|uniref:Ala-interacting subunit n=1 Tax=Thalictrum thalictroides TaxID=46969 RepID=A0A7J6UX65_THATH|nr:Ala-interacting subunit [Thalictrum thalictroides]